METLQQYEEMKQELEQLKKQKEEYISNNYHGIKDDLVEWEESDETCIDFNERIEELENDIDCFEDYLREHGE